MNVDSLIAGITGGGAASAVVIWLTKNWISERLKNSIKSEYDQKLETHKAQLKSQHEIAIEQMRAGFQVAAFEHQIRFSKLHENAAETIAQIYALLTRLVYAINEYTKPMETQDDLPKEARRRLVNQAFKNFQDYYDPRKIYLPRATSEKISAYATKLFGRAFEFAHEVEHGKSSLKWFEILDSLNKDAKPLFHILEDDFRGLLGVDSGLNNMKGKA